MKIKKLESREKKKSKIFVVEEESEPLDLVNPDLSDFIEVTQIDEEVDEDVNFKAEWRGKFKRLNPVKLRVIKLRDLDPEKVYGVHFIHIRTFDLHQIRPFTGLELQRKWRDLTDYGVIRWFPEGNLPKIGFRLLECPNKDYYAICDWKGPKHVPQTPVSRPVIRFKKKEKPKLKLKPKVKVYDPTKKKKFSIRFRNKKGN